MGKIYDPIKCGDEDDWYYGQPDEKCGDCGVGVGNYHQCGCDIERCPACRGQMLSCNCGPVYTVSEKDIEDKTLIKYLTLRQKNEQQLEQKAFKMLSNGEIDMDGYMKMVEKDRVFPEKIVKKSETKLDLLDRLYYIRDYDYDLCQKIELICNTCVSFEFLHNDLEGIVELAMKNVMKDNVVQDYLIEN